MLASLNKVINPDSISMSLKDMDETLKVLRRPLTRSQTKKFQDKLNDLQLAISKCLVMEEKLKPKKKIF